MHQRQLLDLSLSKQVKISVLPALTPVDQGLRAAPVLTPVDLGLIAAPVLTTVDLGLIAAPVLTPVDLGLISLKEYETPTVELRLKELM